MISLAAGKLGWSILKSKTFWKALVIGAILWAIWLGWGFYNAAIAENARLTESLTTVSESFKAQVEEAQKQKAESIRLQNILSSREEVHRERTEQLDAVLRKLKEIEDEDQAVKHWSDTPIPAAILDGVLTESGGD